MAVRMPGQDAAALQMGLGVLRPYGDRRGLAAAEAHRPIAEPEPWGRAAARVRRAMKLRFAWIPWWSLASAVLLIAAFAIAVSASRGVEAVIIGAFAVPTLVLLCFWLLRCRG
jgi:hypothetical protein